MNYQIKNSLRRHTGQPILYFQQALEPQGIAVGRKGHAHTTLKTYLSSGLGRDVKPSPATTASLPPAAEAMLCRQDKP